MTNELTEVEERLIRALAARAEQVTPHSLRPAAPPTGNWAARGRAPLVLALAASVASVALVGTAAVSLLTPREQGSVAGTPSPVPEPPAPGTPSPSAPKASGKPVEPSAPGTSPSHLPGTPDPATDKDAGADPGAGTGAGPGTVPGSGSTQAQPREVGLFFQGSNETRTLRPGGATLTFTVTVLNTIGHTVENATDDLSITADGATLGAGDLNVSLLGEDGVWRPISPTARLTTATLAEGESRAHKIRLSLAEGFPATVDRLQVTAFSNGGQETVTPAP
ncbi:hypothetical protein [Streptomyces thermolilacinus]|uniref:Uncharacterized protein n=1 Tax=Streptomyces thermolilacinus SPC6 TaxID=1306406 RepID=A0A1D3DTK4_9ACTN|nr:hypothetical protein [Streptomyces thermolilacinus]OEJ95661.1 hypothetical protein J116_015370 [Streptomyces thermolilacinus SPC6]